MTTRGSSYTLTYDAENRLTAVSGAATASFVYDADGARVKATFGATTTIYVGGHYEKTGNAVTKYYYAGGRRVAMRTGGQTYYLFPDHLGSTHITTNSSGVQTGRLLYRPWGETRVSSGSTPTTWRFTGQREDATIGLYFCNARFYDPVLGRFTQPDTIVPDPGDPQALNRYSYVLNNPIKYRDPGGHCIPELCPSVPDVEYPGSGTGLRGEAYAQWLYNEILWIEREKAATGGVYNLTSNLIQETAAHELNSFLMDDPEMLGEQFYQQLLMATPQLSAAAASAGASVLMSGGGRVLGAVKNAGSNLLNAPSGSNPWASDVPMESILVGPEGMTVFRAHGGGRATGAWVTQNSIRNQQFVRESLAVKPEWNPATHASEIWLPPGTRIQAGAAGSQGSLYPGGGTQIQILNPSDIARQVVIRTWRLSP